MAAQKDVRPFQNKAPQARVITEADALTRELLARQIYAGLAHDCLMLDGTIDHSFTIQTIQKAYVLADRFLQAGK